jgi:hypothetical protein
MNYLLHLICLGVGATSLKMPVFDYSVSVPDVNGTAINTGNDRNLLWSTKLWVGTPY